MYVRVKLSVSQASTTTTLTCIGLYQFLPCLSSLVHFCLRLISSCDYGHLLDQSK